MSKETEQQAVGQEVAICGLVVGTSSYRRDDLEQVINSLEAFSYVENDNVLQWVLGNENHILNT